MTLRKTLAGIAAAAAVLASAPTSAAPCSLFTDMTSFDESDPFCTSVAWLKLRSITLGCGSGNFCPDSAVTRLQMAAFMSRLGKAFTPRRLFVDQNPGPVTIQDGASQVVCQTADLPPLPIQGGDESRRTATLQGVVWGVVNASVTWTADIWYSRDQGATWKPITNFIPSRTAGAGTMTDGTALAVMEIPAPNGALWPYRFGILVRESQDLPAGTGNFTDLACHLMVEIGNSEPGLAPLPPTPPPPCDARLGGSGLLQPNLGCE